MSMRAHYEEDLAALNRELLKMGLLTENALTSMITALKERKPELAREVVAGDGKIDAAERSLYDRCSLILAREQPVAGTLRHLVSVIRIIPELERIGDHAVKIAKRYDDLTRTEFSKYHASLFEMNRIAVGMLRDSLNAFVEDNSELALETSRRDAGINTIYKNLYREMLGCLRNREEEEVESAVSFLFTSRYLERIGDHVKNICEWVVFSSTGEYVDL